MPDSIPPNPSPLFPVATCRRNRDKVLMLNPTSLKPNAGTAPWNSFSKQWCSCLDDGTTRKAQVYRRASGSVELVLNDTCQRAVKSQGGQALHTCASSGRGSSANFELSSTLVAQVLFRRLLLIPRLQVQWPMSAFDQFHIGSRVPIIHVTATKIVVLMSSTPMRELTLALS